MRADRFQVPGALVSTERHATLGTIPRRQYPPPLPLPPPVYRRADGHVVESRSDEAMPRSLPQEDRTTSRYEIKAARVTAEATKRRLARDAVRTMEPLSFFASNATTSAFCWACSAIASEQTTQPEPRRTQRFARTRKTQQPERGTRRTHPEPRLREPLLQLIVWGEDGMMNAVIEGARITVQFLDDGAVAVHQAKPPELTSAAIQIQHAQLFTRHSEPLRTCGLTSPDIRSRCEPAAARAKT